VSKLKTSPEKRVAALKRDHRTEMDADHAFRKNWPRKKARVNRKRRRAARATVYAVSKGADAEALVVPRRLPGEHLRKMGVRTLGAFVAEKQRRTRTAFLPRYVGLRRGFAGHARSFRTFLAALVQGRSAIATERAKHLLWLLDEELPNNHWRLSEQTWLRRFFAVEPRWEARVRSWCLARRRSEATQRPS
jgi:hypothetical protein